MQSESAGGSKGPGLESQLAEYFDSEWPKILVDWQQFLRFKSVGGESAYLEETEACATWLFEHFQSAGASVAELLQTGGKPLVFAEFAAAAETAPTVLVYGHYDVQPVEPRAAWESDPFEPCQKNGRLYARGARDNKGQLFFVIKAVEALFRSGELQANVKFLIDGEEESGSPCVRSVLTTLKNRLQADALLACETPGLPCGEPALTVGLRGLVLLKLRLQGPRRELHSGHHGGRVYNPAIELVKILSTLYAENGKIALEGFYEGVSEPSAAERALANSVGFNLNAYSAEVGSSVLAGEPGYTPVEQIAFRPTLEVNSIHSGYEGEGVQASIPTTAEVFISMRLVPGQEPQLCLERALKHFKERVPSGMRLEIVQADAASAAVSCDLQSPWLVRAGGVLRAFTAGEPKHLWSGASLPVIVDLVRLLDADPVLVGFGQDSDNEHAPNESFAIDQFRKGFLFVGSFLGSPF